MKTVIRISNDYQSTGAYDEFIEDVDQLVNEHVQVHCEIANSKYENVVEKHKRTADTETYKNKTTFEAKGYSQGDWQRYTLRYNCTEDNKYLLQLIDTLKKSFTHMNDYIVEKFERAEIDGKTFDAEPHDYTSFSIRDIEFPDKDEVISRYNEIYGKDYDEVLTNID